MQRQQRQQTCIGTDATSLSLSDESDASANIYKTFVRPKLEFAVAAWNPWLEMDKKALEKVQERLIRLLSDAKGKTYEEKLEDVGLTTLTERRERGDAIEAFKLSMDSIK